MKEKRYTQLEQAQIAKAEADVAVADQAVEAAKELDPFWFWEPGDGLIDVPINKFTDQTKRELLGRWLKPEDIPEQTDSQLNALLCVTSIKGVSGGNGSGKTDVGTIDGLMNATGEIPNSLKPYVDYPAIKRKLERARSKVVMGRVTGVDNKQLHRVVLPMWQKYVPRAYLKDGSWEKSYNKEFDVLTLYRGKKVCSKTEFLTNEQKVKSSQGGTLDWAKFDEEPEQAKYKETMLRFRSAPYLDLEIDWTPTEGLTWATDLFHDDVFEDEEDDTDKALFKLASVANDFALNTSEKLKTFIAMFDGYAKVSSYEEMKMRLLGEAISLTGLVYSGLFNRSIHVIPPFPITYGDYIVYRGLDPHTVKPSVCVELAVDRMGYEYVCGCYMEAVDTEVIKADLAQRARERKYRLGWSRCDKSANSTIKALGDRNIFLELARGKNAIPALDLSEKATGSIHAGVDEIKKLLKSPPLTPHEEAHIRNHPESKAEILSHKKPKFYIFDIPENQLLIKAFQTLEREAYANEDKKGLKDRIAEGKHDAHAALRYIHQRKIRWLPPTEQKPHYEDEESYV